MTIINARTVQTIQEMLKQRGYTVNKQSCGGNTLLLGDKDNDDGIVAFCNSEGKIGVSCIKEKIGILQSLGRTRCILVYAGTVTSMAEQMSGHIPGVSVELFSEAELQYNITKHRLVPLHERLTPEEQKTFTTAYGTKIPVLLTSDPIARFYNFLPGDIIRVTRTRSPTESYVTYRIVKHEK